MSLRPGVFPAIPENTVRVARASFPKGGRYMRLRDELGAVFDDARFAGLFPARGSPAEAPWRLALVTLFQFAEGLPDRQAAEAVRGRIDWKYALALSLTDPGFDSTVLSEFRSRHGLGRSRGCSTRCWRSPVNGTCCRQVGGNGPTPRMCWPRCRP